MADETTTEETTTTGTDAPPAETATDGHPELPEGVKEILRNERAAARAAEARAKAAEARAQEYEDAQKTELERERERADRAMALVREATAKAVAARHGLPPEFADRLRGDDEQAMEEDATSLLSALKAREPDTAKPQAPPARTGATPDPSAHDDPELVLGRGLLALARPTNH